MAPALRRDGLALRPGGGAIRGLHQLFLRRSHLLLRYFPRRCSGEDRGHGMNALRRIVIVEDNARGVLGSMKRAR